MPKKTANKNRLIVACVVETGRSAQDVATQFKVSRQWVHILVARYRAGGWEAVQPQSTRPHSSPRSVEPQLRNRIIALRKSLDEQGLDAGAATISWHLERQGLPSQKKNTPVRRPGCQRSPETSVNDVPRDHIRRGVGIRTLFELSLRGTLLPERRLVVERAWVLPTRQLQLVAQQCNDFGESG